ncbi:hypothetical protein CONCODRAFT_72757 [Conidiobolus coronatus NRRL 28638]|uniref:Uncharacterized protein n=1 Tax=Conidiobolus coronatus (strain ATCC 28846 / CBS 209.66 / NRRL 28638) TaxID=796925 RepID=A0A137NYQ4_CONC2|nr:hypothetical protein CONCODRAFT_72757 [Conidiobolus coronatus NRRL 28638]|eukprot:KXN67739.1 hypothetical protein CONCODRAFT_72757 [Conidiobolus coronatus NRRL 28638]
MNSSQLELSISNDKAFCLTEEQSIKFIDRLSKEPRLSLISTRGWVGDLSQQSLDIPESSPELTSSSGGEDSPASSAETIPTPGDREQRGLEDASSPESVLNQVTKEGAECIPLSRSASAKAENSPGKVQSWLINNQESKVLQRHTFGNLDKANPLGILTSENWKTQFNQIKNNFNDNSPTILVNGQLVSDDDEDDENEEEEENEEEDPQSPEYKLRETLMKLEANPTPTNDLVAAIPMPSLDAPRPSREESIFIDPAIQAMLREIQNRPSRPQSTASIGNRSRANSTGSNGSNPLHSSSNSNGYSGNALPRDSMGRKGFGSIRSKLFQGFNPDNLQAAVIIEEKSPDLENPLPITASPIPVIIHKNPIIKSPYSTKASLKPSLDWSIEERTSLAIEVHQVLSLPQPVLFRPSSLYHRPARNSILGKNSDWSLFSEPYRPKRFSSTFLNQPLGFWLFTLGFLIFPLWLVGSIIIPNSSSDTTGENYKWRTRCRLASITLISVGLFSLITISIYHPFWSGFRAIN